MLQERNADERQRLRRPREADPAHADAWRPCAAMFARAHAVAASFVATLGPLPHAALAVVKRHVVAAELEKARLEAKLLGAC